MHIKGFLVALLSLSLSSLAVPVLEEQVFSVADSLDYPQLLELDTDALVDVWRDQVLSLHNSNRAKYGARPLTWSNALYPATLQYAQQCKFQHSNGGGKYGENLAAGTGSYGMPQAMNGWMAEASKYDYNHPGFSSGTGHFTQVVWKSTTQVACAIANCRAGTIFSQASKYVICRYSPPGNFQGQFPQNVGRPK